MWHLGFRPLLISHVLSTTYLGLLWDTRGISFAVLVRFQYTYVVRKVFYGEQGPRGTLKNKRNTPRSMAEG